MTFILPVLFISLEWAFCPTSLNQYHNLPTELPLLREAFPDPPVSVRPAPPPPNGSHVPTDLDGTCYSYNFIFVSMRLFDSCSPLSFKFREGSDCAYFCLAWFYMSSKCHKYWTLDIGINERKKKSVFFLL